MTQSQVAVVHGANIAYLELSENGKPKLANLLAVRQAAEQRGYRPLVLIDDQLPYEIDAPAQLRALLAKQHIRQTPGGVDPDEYLLSMAHDLSALVISNDRFRDYLDRYPWIEQRRVPLKIVRGSVELNSPQVAPVRR